MGDIEKIGLLKIDFLGLRTLTLLDNAVKLIEKTRGEKIDVYKLPLDDPETYALLQRGDAKGVFQFESDGIRDLLRRLRPDNIHDIIACTALYRPGPLEGGMVDDYVNRKHGREKPIYEHPVMEEVLAETFGVMVYQEQCMRILNRLGDIELSSAYVCIKAISKKKQDVIDRRRADFLQGAQARGVGRDTAEKIFGLIVNFGGYGFNKSHSAAYAMISYQTAYLKAHYTPEFTAALLSSEIEDGNKRDAMVDHIADARKSGVEVLPPDVNASDGEFIVRDGKVVFGLTAIKGVGGGASEAIAAARVAKGAFKDLYDFCERVDQRLVNRTVIEKLVKAGAFDSMGAHRSRVFAAAPRALQAATERQNDRRLGQRNLFDAGGGDEGAPVAEPLPDVPPWPEAEKLKYEKEVLDFYFSSHPLAECEAELRRFSSHAIDQLKLLPPDHEVTLGGMLSQVRLMNTKKARNGNSRYLRCKVEDLTGVVECVMWPDDFVRYQDEVKEDRVCFVRGVVERTREEPGLVLSRILSVEQAQRELARGLYILLKVGVHRPSHVDSLGPVLQKTPGGCPVFLTVRDPAGKDVVLKLDREYAINPSTYLQEELEAVVGTGGVKLA
jgi:DNA polymerase-3 subunit alpha